MDDDEADPQEFYGIRDGTLFVIDSTPKMFQIDPKTETSYFLQCLQQYREILRQKLSWSRQDWMGLILFGLENWDMDPETRHILTLQKLKLPVVDDLREIMKIEQGGWKEIEKVATLDAYPLHNVIWHAAQQFCNVKITMPLRRVILFTCQDDPPLTDNNEKHRIRVKAKSYSDIGLQLFVVGLGENWDIDRFYKDLELLAREINLEDYEQTSLKDLVQQAKAPSKIAANIPWRLGQGVQLDVSICNTCVKVKYLKKTKVSKHTNVPLTTKTYWTVLRSQDNESRPDRPPSPVVYMDLNKYKKYGGRKIRFTLPEVQTLSAIREPGIDLICVKPISYHPLYHLKAPYFVSYNKKSHRKDNQLLFAALLDKCELRNVMMICAVTIRRRSSPIFYSMIPNGNCGGFFLYKMPFRENVRDVGKFLSQYIYDDKYQPPTNPEGIDLMAKIAKRLRMIYDPTRFPNPKLRLQLQTIETYGLDLEKMDPPADPTLPNVEIMKTKVERYLSQFDETFYEHEETAAPASKKYKLAELGNVEYYTVQHLKNILRSAGVSTTGRKDQLIKKVRALCNSKKQ